MEPYNTLVSKNEIIDRNEYTENSTDPEKSNIMDGVFFSGDP